MSIPEPLLGLILRPRDPQQPAWRPSRREPFAVGSSTMNYDQILERILFKSRDRSWDGVNE